jgi:hypothetical protein
MLVPHIDRFHSLFARRVATIAAEFQRAQKTPVSSPLGPKRQVDECDPIRRIGYEMRLKLIKTLSVGPKIAGIDHRNPSIGKAYIAPA